jgi:hypothetical protein
MEAVLYGDDPRHKQRLFTAVDGVVDKQKIEGLRGIEWAILRLDA